MSYSKELATTFTDTRLRTPNNLCEVSGMCSTCSDDCTGICEIGLSAVRGGEATYPYNTSNQQFASEKKYPFDYSHFNINGRVFGAIGAEEDSEKVNVNSVNLSCEIGYDKKIKLKAPIILPAIAKLNWRDYYSGAAIAGVIAVIGESAIKSDVELQHDNKGKVLYAPLLNEMVHCFRKYDRGYGDIVLQVNADDIAVGTPEYALANCDIKTLEIKLGQGAKGIQHFAPVYSYDEAVSLKKKGYLIEPDPLDDNVKKEYFNNEFSYFIQYGRLPMWNEGIIAKMVNRYRCLGAENIFFKMAGYDIEDIQRVLQIASDNKIALVTFDGAGGGTGHSPCKMMNEWGHPTIELEKIVCEIINDLKNEGKYIPAIAIAGGITMEDNIFKVLAIGAPYVKVAGIGRGAMAAAMVAKNIGEMIEKGNVPPKYRCYGEKSDDIFREEKRIKKMYDNIKDKIPLGAIGVYSYIDRLSTGLRLFMTLNRKFDLKYINQKDVIPLTNDAKRYIKDLENVIINNYDNKSM
ncbi:MAG: glutamate synthase-related protein [Anaerocolumna sp.]